MNLRSSLVLVAGPAMLGGALQGCSAAPPTASPAPATGVTSPASSTSAAASDGGPTRGGAGVETDGGRTASGHLLDAALLREWARAAADRSGDGTRAPRPFFLTQDTPVGPAVFTAYQTSWLSSSAPRFPALGPVDPSGLGDIGDMESHASLLLARSEDPGDLAGLTDFSGLTNSPRIALACEMFLGQPPPPDTEGDEAWWVVRRMRELCAAKGTLVPADKVARLLTRRVKMFRANDCGLPSGRYGAYVPQSGAPAAELPYRWADFAGRAPEFAQPCVGAFLYVEAQGRAGQSLGSGWMMTRAVADLGRVPFPFQDQDSEHGGLSDFRAAPRGEFVSARAGYRGGAGLYLGKAPLWIARKSLLGSDGYLSASFGTSALPRCTADEAAGRATVETACELAPEAPFLFPIDARGTWTRQVLSTADARFAPTRARSDAERRNREDTVITAMGQLRRFFKAAERPASVTNVEGAAEKLSAMWHSLQTYRAFPESERLHQLQVVPLTDETVVLIPAQGYMPLGALDPSLVERLGDSLDALQRLDAAPAGAFETFDLERQGQ